MPPGISTVQTKITETIFLLKLKSYIIYTYKAGLTNVI